MAQCVMVVEDDEELNEVLSYNLTRAGYRVVQQHDGREAMEAMLREPPDLLLLDLMLPGADGWEICRFVAQTPELQQIPVVIHSARGAREDSERAREFINLAGYFTKPYMTADVIRHIQRILAGPDPSQELP